MDSENIVVYMSYTFPVLRSSGDTSKYFTLNKTAINSLATSGLEQLHATDGSTLTNSTETFMNPHLIGQRPINYRLTGLCYSIILCIMLVYIQTLNTQTTGSTYTALVAVFVSLFVLSLTLNVIVVIVMIRLILKNKKSVTSSPSKPSVSSYNVIEIRPSKKNDGIGTNPNDAYEGIDAGDFEMKSNVLYGVHQQKDLDTTSRDSTYNMTV